jgi:hypothetical protein
MWAHVIQDWQCDGGVSVGVGRGVGVVGVCDWVFMWALGVGMYAGSCVGGACACADVKWCAWDDGQCGYIVWQLGVGVGVCVGMNVEPEWAWVWSWAWVWVWGSWGVSMGMGVVVSMYMGTRNTGLTMCRVCDHERICVSACAYACVYVHGWTHMRA